MTNCETTTAARFGRLLALAVLKCITKIYINQSKTSVPNTAVPRDMWALNVLEEVTGPIPSAGFIMLGTK